MSFPSKRIRLQVNCTDQRIKEDELTLTIPRFLKPSWLRIEVALFDDDNEAIRSLDGLDQLICTIKAKNPRTGLAVMQSTVAIADMNPTLTLEEWQGGAAADCHAVFEFEADETNVELEADEVEFYLVIAAISDDSPGHEIPLANCSILIEESGAFVDPPASLVADDYYTKAQSDARYLLAADLTSKVNKAGDTMTGLLVLSGAPTTGLHATTKTYVDAADALKLALAGGTMTGALTLSGAPSSSLHAATKAYADLMVPLAGGTMTGALTLSGAPSSALHAATKAYVDSTVGAGAFVPLAGGTMTGLLTLSGAPTVNLHAATKLYVDTAIANLVNSAPGALDTLNELATALGADANFSATMTTALAGKLALAGGTMTGALTLSGAPSSSLHAATKAYADLMVPLAGGTMTGMLTLSGAPSSNNHAARKLYVDDSVAVKLSLSGGTMSGPLSFSGTTNYGLLVNSLTSTQITAISSPPNGIILYDSTLNQFKFREASTWKALSGSGGGTTWLHDSGTPGGGLGSDGDYYLDEDDGEIFFKTSGAWATLIPPPLPLAGGEMSGAITFPTGMYPSLDWEFFHTDVDSSGWRLVINSGSVVALRVETDSTVIVESGDLEVQDGDIDCAGVLKIQGTQVVGEQYATGATDLAGVGAFSDGASQTAINYIYAVLRHHGLIPT